MTSPPSNRCGYTWPQDGEADTPTAHQCWREVAAGAESRCIWHATPGTVTQSPEALRNARAPPEVRDENSPFDELLDGASLTGVELDDVVSFGNVALREADLSKARLCRVDLSDASLGGTDLSNADLRGADLSNTHLGRADLSNADLTGADLSNGYLYGADLSEADLENAITSDVDLRNADLSETSMPGVDLSDTDLSRADLSGADLSAIDFSGSNLRNSGLANTGLAGADFSDANLSGADLSNAHLGAADLSRAALSGADLSGTSLNGADISGADLTGADLSNADLTGADISEASLDEADCSDADLEGCRLDSATFSKTALGEATLPSGTRLADADLSECNLEGQDLRDMELTDAYLWKANLTDADLSGADLSGANLERALLNRTDLFDTCFAGARLQGVVLGDAQVNEGTFERLDPGLAAADGDAGPLRRLKRLIVGPTGDDAVRCVYDPASQFDLAEGSADEMKSDSTGGTADNGAHEDDPEVRAGGVYRQFERLARDNALPDWQHRFFILRQDMQTRQKTGIDHRFAQAQRAVFGYGESFSRVIGWGGVLILAFSLVYLLGGWVRPVEAGGGLGPPIVWMRVPGDPTVLWESLYYSTLTFTALGFGDFRPTNTVGQLLTVLETVSGAVLLALLVFVLGRRAAR